jgi:hypothetical protein
MVLNALSRCPNQTANLPFEIAHAIQRVSETEAAHRQCVRCLAVDMLGCQSLNSWWRSSAASSQIPCPSAPSYVQRTAMRIVKPQKHRVDSMNALGGAVSLAAQRCLLSCFDVAKLVSLVESSKMLIATP